MSKEALYTMIDRVGCTATSGHAAREPTERARAGIRERQRR